MKKITTVASIAIAAALVAALAGCEAEPASTPSSSSGSQEIAAAPGFDGTTITVGLIGVSSGAFAGQGKAHQAGKISVIKAVNAAGGIGGKYKLAYKFADGAYDATVAVPKYEEMKSDVVMVDVLGSAVIDALLPKLAQDKMVAAPVSFDTKMITNPNILVNGVPAQVLALNGLDYSFKHGGENLKYCPLVLDNVAGQNSLDGFNYAAEKLGFKTGDAVKVAATETDLTGAMNKFQAAGCTAIFSTTAPAQSGSAIVAGDQAGFNPKFVLTMSSFDPSAMTAGVEKLYENQVIVSAQYPQWNDTSIPGMQSMIDAAKKYAPDYVTTPNAQFNWGYAQMETVVALLEKAVANKDLSRDGVLKAVGELGQVDLGGVWPEYDYVTPGDRTPPTSTFILVPDSKVPGTLKKLENNYSSEIAKTYKY